MVNEKTKTARLSIFSNLFLIIIKMVVGLITGSVSIMSEAIHSGLDLIASLISYFAVKISSKPPDEDHPYGHGKFENVSGVLEALLIFIAALWIIYEAVNRLLNKSDVQYLGYGILVMIISMIVNYIVSSKLYIVAQKYDSVALEADALHLKTDVYSSLGISLGFVLMYFTGYIWLDSVIAILVALLIIYESYSLLNNAFSPLVDMQLPEKEVALIKSALNEKLSKYKNISYTRLRTRKSGSQKYLDFILFVPDETTVLRAHDLCDEIEDHIKLDFKDIDINIHIEPNDLKV